LSPYGTFLASPNLILSQGKGSLIVIIRLSFGI
jgi:hypothetical protein